jgi:2-polyprenyl-3-methyl-5-hydroxy-6-metoxy-1,4-benzoquinol methylase
VKEAAQMEHAIGIVWQEDEERKHAPEINSPVIIRGKTKRPPLIGQMLALALQSTKSDAPAVLDYGFGGGLDLGILWALRLDKVVGYNPHNYLFEQVRKYLHPNVILIDNPDELDELAPFDLLVCSSVMEHVQDPVGTLDHIYQLLKPGGIAWFSAPSLSRKQMAGHARSVKQGIKVKLLHPGHIQLWNNDTLPFSTFIERRGFQLVFADLGIPPRDLRSLKDVLWMVAAHAKRSLQVSRAFVAMRTGRYKSQAFLARKIA